MSERISTQSERERECVFRAPGGGQRPRVSRARCRRRCWWPSRTGQQAPHEAVSAQEDQRPRVRRDQIGARRRRSRVGAVHGLRNPPASPWHHTAVRVVRLSPCPSPGTSRLFTQPPGAPTGRLTVDLGRPTAAPMTSFTRPPLGQERTGRDAARARGHAGPRGGRRLHRRRRWPAGAPATATCFGGRWSSRRSSRRGRLPTRRATSLPGSPSASAAARRCTLPSSTFRHPRMRRPGRGGGAALLRPRSRGLMGCSPRGRAAAPQRRRRRGATPPYTIVFSHGNGEDLGTAAGFLEELAHVLQVRAAPPASDRRACCRAHGSGVAVGRPPSRQVNVVGYDYPGYGPIYDSGRDALPPPTEHGACEALAAVLAWLQDPQGKNTPLSQIVLYAARAVWWHAPGERSPAHAAVRSMRHVRMCLGRCGHSLGSGPTVHVAASIAPPRMPGTAAHMAGCGRGRLTCAAAADSAPPRASCGGSGRRHPHVAAAVGDAGRRPRHGLPGHVRWRYLCEPGQDRPGRLPRLHCPRPLRRHRPRRARQGAWCTTVHRLGSATAS